MIKIKDTKYKVDLYIRVGKQDLWGLGAESQCIVESFPFAKMILSFANPITQQNITIPKDSKWEMRSRK